MIDLTEEIAHKAFSYPRKVFSAIKRFYRWRKRKRKEKQEEKVRQEKKQIKRVKKLHRQQKQNKLSQILKELQKQNAPVLQSSLDTNNLRAIALKMQEKDMKQLQNKLQKDGIFHQAYTIPRDGQERQQYILYYDKKDSEKALKAINAIERDSRLQNANESIEKCQQEIKENEQKLAALGGKKELSQSEQRQKEALETRNNELKQQMEGLEQEKDAVMSEYMDKINDYKATQHPIYTSNEQKQTAIKEALQDVQMKEELQKEPLYLADKENPSSYIRVENRNEQMECTVVKEGKEAGTFYSKDGMDKLSENIQKEGDFSGKVMLLPSKEELEQYQKNFEEQQKEFPERPVDNLKANPELKDYGKVKDEIREDLAKQGYEDRGKEGLYKNGQKLKEPIQPRTKEELKDKIAFKNHELNLNYTEMSRLQRQKAELSARMKNIESRLETAEPKHKEELQGNFNKMQEEYKKVNNQLTQCQTKEEQLRGKKREYQGIAAKGEKSTAEVRKEKIVEKSQGEKEAVGIREATGKPQSLKEISGRVDKQMQSSKEIKKQGGKEEKHPKIKKSKGKEGR